MAALVVHLMSPGAAANQPGWNAPDGSVRHEFVSWREIPPGLSKADLVVAHGLAALVVSQTMANIGPGLVYRPTGTHRARRRPGSRRLRASWVAAADSRTGLATAAAFGLDRDRVVVVPDDDRDAWDRVAWSLVRFEQFDGDLLPGRPRRAGPWSTLRRAFGRPGAASRPRTTPRARSHARSGRTRSGRELALAPPVVQAPTVDAPVVDVPAVDALVVDVPTVVRPVLAPPAAPVAPARPEPVVEPTTRTRRRRVFGRKATRRGHLGVEVVVDPAEADVPVEYTAVEEPVLDRVLDVPVVDLPVVEVAPVAPARPEPAVEPTTRKRRRRVFGRKATRRGHPGVGVVVDPAEADVPVEDTAVDEPVLDPVFDVPVVDVPVVDVPVVEAPPGETEAAAPAQRLERPFDPGPVAPPVVEAEPVIEPEVAPPVAPQPAVARVDPPRIASTAPRGSPPIVAMESVDSTSPGHPWWKYRRPDARPRTFGGGPQSSTPRPVGNGPVGSGEGGNGAGGNGGHGNGAGGNGALGAAPPPGEPPAPGPPAETPPEPAGDARSTIKIVQTAVSSGIGLFIIGAALLVAVAVGAQIGIIGEGPVLVPAAGLCMVIAAGRRIVRNHPAEAWVANWLLVGFFVKLGAAYARYFTSTVTYGGGDVIGYDKFGREYAQHWLKGFKAPVLAGLKETNFIRWFTGVVYYVFGQNLLTGTFVFALLALIGSYFWYRATVDAIPMIDKKLYLGFVLFAPSIAFWPAEVGKEALMQLGLGTLALGLSFLLRQQLLAGLLVALPGGWLVWVVRPHLLAMVAIAAGAAYLVGRVNARAGKKAGLFSRPLGIVVVAFLVAFTVGQGAKFLGLSSFSFSSVQSELDATTASSSQGGSSFSNSGHTLNPINYPQDVLTVLVRPFPWEVSTGLQLFASAEGMALAVLAVKRRESLRIAFRRSRENPFLMFAWVLTALYCVAFASFANFGLLVRQRSLVLPAVLLLISVDPTFEHRRRRAEEQAQVWSAAALASRAADA